MCRSIKQLRHAEAPATEEEIQAAALQYIRKVSGYRQPSQANRAVFDRAVAEVATTTRLLLQGIGSSTSTPRPAPGERRMIRRAS